MIEGSLPYGPRKERHGDANQQYTNENQQDQDFHGSPFRDSVITVYASVMSELSGISTAATHGFIKPAIASDTATRL